MWHLGFDHLDYVTFTMCDVTFISSTSLWAFTVYVHCTLLYCTVLYCTVLYCAEMYCTVLYWNVLYCTVLYCTVRTVAADLRRGEHIPKMQNNIGRKSMLCVLRQLRSKDGGGGATGCRAVPGHAARRLAWRCILHNCREFTPDRIWWIRRRQRQKHRMGSNHHTSEL